MIRVQSNRPDFEYDIYSLVKAFFPEMDVIVSQEEISEEAFLKITVFYHNKDFIEISLTDQNGTRTARGHVLPGEPERRKEKSAIKRLLYGLLREHTGKDLPWGDLTGIRPTKIVMSLLNNGETKEDTVRYMREQYLVSEAKAELAADIAVREKKLLDGFDYQNGYSLYVGIPFCPSICLYCSFSSSPLKIWENQVDDYLDALEKEIETAAETFGDKVLHTVYIGGGTPTTLTPSQMDRLLSKLEERFDYSGLLEFTVEAGRPDSIDKEKLQVIRAHGIDRISINPQTMNQSTLDTIGRKHTVEDIKEAFGLARSLGFSNINMDLIVGLPGEGLAEVSHTMSELEQLDPDSVTVHSLALKRASRMSLMLEEYQSTSFLNNSAIMDMTRHSCESRGLFPYYMYRQKNIAGNFENVGYAREGKECLYNVLIMEEVQSILALGAGGSTKIVWPGGRIERVENVKDIRNYIDRIDEMIQRKRRIKDHG